MNHMQRRVGLHSGGTARLGGGHAQSFYWMSFFPKHERDLYFQNCLVLRNRLKHACVAAKCLRRDRHCVGVGGSGVRRRNSNMEQGRKRSVCSQIDLKNHNRCGHCLHLETSDPCRVRWAGGARFSSAMCRRKFRMHARSRRLVGHRSQYPLFSGTTAFRLGIQTLHAWMMATMLQDALGLLSILRPRFNLTHPRCTIVCNISPSPSPSPCSILIYNTNTNRTESFSSVPILAGGRSASCGSPTTPVPAVRPTATAVS